MLSPCRRVARDAFRLTLVIALTGLGACKLGPDFARPEVEATESWQTEIPNDRVTQDSPPQPTLEAWWQNLDDPVLNRLVSDALQANPGLQAARFRARKARALVGVAESRLLPRAGASASYTQVELSERLPVLGQLLRQTRTDTRQDLYEAGFDASWELDVFGGSRRAVEAGVAQAAAAEAGLADARLSLQTEVVRNYIQLRLAQKELAALQEQSELQAQILSLRQAQLTSGVGTEPAQLRAEARQRRLQSQIPRLRARELAAVYRMCVLTGQSAKLLTGRLGDSTDLPHPPDLVPVGLPGEILRRRPDVHRAERQLEAATAKIGVNRARLFPRFSLTGSAGVQASRFTHLFESGSGTWTILPGVSWALFQGGKIRAQVDAAELERDAAYQSYRQVIEEAVAEVESALTRYGLSFQTRQSIASMVNAQREAVERARAAYQTGVASQIKLLKAKSALAKARGEQAGARAATLLALATLEKALGGGWAETGEADQEVATLSESP